MSFSIRYLASLCSAFLSYPFFNQITTELRFTDCGAQGIITVGSILTRYKTQEVAMVHAKPTGKLDSRTCQPASHGICSQLYPLCLVMKTESLA